VKGGKLVNETALKIHLYGIVQGVGMRHHVRRQAQHHGVRGYVKNLASGSVECAAIGARPAVASFLSAVREHPPGRIDRIETTPLDTDEPFVRFEIRF